jgi:hypothetical protein
LEGEIFSLIGQFMLDREDLTEDEAKKGLQYLHESRKMNEAIGNLRDAIALEAKIVHFKAMCIDKFGAQEAFGKPQTQEQVLELQRISYQVAVSQKGEASPVSLTLGSNLATE